MLSVPMTLEKLKELITCSLCLDIFRTPKALQCLHTYCEECLRDIVKRSRYQDKSGYKCPSCRKFTPEAEVKSNFHTVQLIDLYSEATQPKTCVHCDTQGAAWKCNDCVEYFCGPCKNGHLKIRVLRYHKMAPIEDVEDQLVINKPVNCTNHPEETVKYNCKTCKVLLCITCALLHHGGHQYETITDALTTHLQELKGFTEDVKQNAQRYSSQTESLKELKNQTKVMFDSALNATSDHKEAVIAKVETDFEALKTKLIIMQRDEMTKIEKGVQQREAKSAELNAVVSCVENTLSTAQGAPLMIEIRERLLPTLMDTVQDLDIPNVPTLNIPSFVPSTDVVSGGNILGDVAVRVMSATNYTCRFQNVDASKIFTTDMKPSKTFDIHFPGDAVGYRMACGYGKVLVAFFDIHTIIQYTDEGERLSDIILNGKIQEPRSVVILSRSTIAVAAENGLYLVDLQSSEIAPKFAGGNFCDIDCVHNVLYALCASNGTVLIVEKTSNWETAKTHSVDTKLGTLCCASTLVAANSSIYICTYGTKITKFSLNGELLSEITIPVPMNFVKLCAILHGDVMLVTNYSKSIWAVASGQSSAQYKLECSCVVQDVIFQGKAYIWMLNRITGSQYQLHRYNLQQL